MSTSEIVSLVISIIAIVLSIISTVFLIIFEVAKLKSTYRERFTDSIRNNQNLENLVSSIRNAKENRDYKKFESIHVACVKYKDNIESVSLFSRCFYKKLKRNIQKIDDEAILVSQKKFDDINYEIDFRIFERLIRRLFVVIERYYLGQ